MNDNFVILNKELKYYKENGKNRTRNFYNCKCLKHNYCFSMTTTQYKQGNGCPICSSKKVVVGINSIQDTNPELINFIYNKDDALKYTSHSNKYIYFQCPNCKNLKKAAICNIVTNGFYCQFCNDNISYPNKFIRCFLQQLNIDFEVEKTFIWSNGKIYDQYIPELNAIIENHGRQHYLSTSQWKNNRDEQKNDKIKKEIAKNNVTYYIEIDCSVSSKEYIKNSLMKSELSSLFDLSQIDWDYCEQYALSNLLKKVCADWELYNDYYQLKQTYNLSVTTLRSYIHKGCEYGLCSKEYYAPLKSKVENSQDINAKPIFCKTDNIYFFSSRLCEEYYKKNDSTFSRSHLGTYINKNKKYHNKEFYYITKSEYNKKKKSLSCFSDYTVIGGYFNESFKNFI